MSFYFYQLICSTVIAEAVSIWRRHWISVVPFCLVFVVFFLPAAIRYGIGTDYFYIYVPGLDMVATTGENSQWELGFLTICKLVLYFDLPDQWLFGIASFLTCFFALISFPRKGFVWCVLGFAVVMYLQSYNAVRQELAVAFCLVAFVHHLRQKNFLASVLFLSAFLFHTSTVILVPIVAGVQQSLRYQCKTIVGASVAIAIFIWIFHPLDVFMRLISLVPFAESYLEYENSDGYMGTGVANTGLGYLLWYVVWFTQGVFLLLKCRSRQGREIGVWCLVAFLVKLVGSQVNIFARVCFATDAILPFSLSLMARRVRSTPEKFIFTGIVLLIVVSFLRDYGFNSNVQGTGEVLPYRTVFD